MAEIKQFSKEKILDYPEQQELYERILKLIHEYDDDMSPASSLGILEFAKDTLMNHHRE